MNGCIVFAERSNSRSGALPGLVAASAIGVRYGLPAGVTPKVDAPLAVGATGSTMPGVPRLYKSLRVKAAAHVLADVLLPSRRQR